MFKRPMAHNKVAQSKFDPFIPLSKSVCETLSLFMYYMRVHCYVRCAACSTTDDTLDKKDEIAFSSLTKVTEHFNESLEFVFNI